MGYMHIDNLYKDSRIFQFDECYALEKVHGTSAHISYSPDTKELKFFSGGESYDKFVALFDQAAIKATLDSFTFVPTPKKITFYGEAYGGKQQGMRETYGDTLKFVVFDVRWEYEHLDSWLNVDAAEKHTKDIGLEFVDYVRINTKLSEIDFERDKPSTQARRNGILEAKLREGVVLRPITEAVDHRGNRIITKHKNAQFCETKTPRVVDPNKLVVLAEANKIADEWVTKNRFDHVLDQVWALQVQASAAHGIAIDSLDITHTGIFISAMIEDVLREAKDEIVVSAEAKRAIGSATARMYKKWLQDQINVGV